MSEDDALAWQLVCPVPSDAVSSLPEITRGACCGSTLPRNELDEPPSCSLCPDEAPRNGDPCSLADDCVPALIDCFYKCCCYGSVTWAQCDGKTWHVPTECSEK